MTKEDCIQNQRPPAEMKKGESLRSGRFYRNLKSKEVVKRYANDQDEEPEYGYKIKSSHWDNALSRGDLSVNLSECAQCPACSIQLHPTPEIFKHVLEIDLQALANEINQSLLARYEPIGDNKCHFEIIGEDSITAAQMLIKDCIDQGFPPGTKCPNSDEEKEAAQQAIETWEQIFRLWRFPLEQD